MASTTYGYSAEPTRNPFRYLRAAWRLVRLDPETTTDDAAVVELGFARSKIGRRFARWEVVVDSLHQDLRTATAIRERKPFGPIRLEALEELPERTLGRVFAAHCRTRSLNPNLVRVPPTDEIGWLLNHLFQTHDVWHVVTGWGNDIAGEIGLGAFYAAQLGNPAFFGYLLALVQLNMVWRGADLGQFFEAFCAGYESGKQSQPLFGADWDALWAVPLDEVRTRFGISTERRTGEGIRAAA